VASSSGSVNACALLLDNKVDNAFVLTGIFKPLVKCQPLLGQMLMGGMNRDMTMLCGLGGEGNMEMERERKREREREKERGRERERERANQWFRG
jgi:hypothetical protein